MKPDMDNTPAPNNPVDVDVEPIDFESLDLLLEQLKQYRETNSWVALWSAVTTFCREVGEKFELAAEEKNALESLSQIAPLDQKILSAFDLFFEKIKKYGTTLWSPYADLIASVGLEYLNTQEQKQKLATYLQSPPLCDPICRRFAKNGLSCNLPTFASAFFATAFTKNKVLADFAESKPDEIPELFQNFLIAAQRDGGDAYVKFMESIITKVDLHRLSLVIGPILEMNDIKLEKQDSIIAQLQSKIETVKTEEFYKSVTLIKQFGKASLLNIRVARRRVIEILESIEPKGFRFSGAKYKAQKEETIAEVDGFFDWLDKTVRDVINAIDAQVSQLEKKASDAYHSEPGVSGGMPPKPSDPVAPLTAEATPFSNQPTEFIKEFYESVAGAMQTNKTAEATLSDIILFASDLRINLKEFGVDVKEIGSGPQQLQPPDAPKVMEVEAYQKTIAELEGKIETMKAHMAAGMKEIKNELEPMCQSVASTETKVENTLKSYKIDKSIRTDVGHSLLQLFGVLKTNTDKLAKKCDLLVEDESMG